MHYYLVAGVSPKWLETAADKGYDTGPRGDSAAITASAQKMLEELKGFKELHWEGHAFFPGNDENWAEFLTLLRSRKWDAISYGGGVRTIPQLGDMFTELIDLARKEQPQAQLIFPLLPEGVVTGLRKWVPEAK